MNLKQLKIGIVTSRFNSEITEKLEAGAIEYLESSGIEGLEIYAVRVPGAVEIPLACQALFEKGCDGVVALGAVIRGETSHYNVVCNSVERGVSQLMLTYKKPIGFGVLTTEDEEQAYDRVGGKQGHKGREAAEVVIEMIGLLSDLKKPLPLPALLKSSVKSSAKAKNAAVKTKLSNKNSKKKK